MINWLKCHNSRSKSGNDQAVDLTEHFIDLSVGIHAGLLKESSVGVGIDDEINDKAKEDAQKKTDNKTDPGNSGFLVADNADQTQNQTDR